MAFCRHRATTDVLGMVLLVHLDGYAQVNLEPTNDLPDRYATTAPL